MCPFEAFFDWRQTNISNWKKCLRMTLKHDFKDIVVRGHSAQEIATDMLRMHKKDLEPDEIEFLEGLFK
jgi:hypothetical protein